MSRLVINCLSTILASALLVGCANKETYKPEHTSLYRDKDITVYLNGGMIVKFDAGKYLISEHFGTTVIKGSGTEIVSVLPYRIKPFEGEIALAEIERIESSEISTMGRVSLGLTIVLLLAVVGSHGWVWH